MIYFASDLHLGAPYIKNHKEHEARVVRWLESIRADATELYILGDVFDYWFEYHSVVPRGNVRFLGKVAELVDSGVRVHFFTGNHDVWMFDYLQNELGVIVHTEDLEFTASGKSFYVGHGDRTGDDRWYAFMMWCFRNPFLQFCYRWLHPDLANIIATTWSSGSRKKNNNRQEYLMSIAPDNERQTKFARRLLESKSVDFFIFGHRHRLLRHPLSPSSVLFIVGDWIRHFSYASFDGSDVRVHSVPYAEPLF